MGIVDRTVQRIDIPGTAGFAAQLAAFLGIDAVIGMTPADLVDQVSLGTVVNLSHQVDLAFIFHLNFIFDPRPQAEALAQDFPCAAGHLFNFLKCWMRGDI